MNGSRPSTARVLVLVPAAFLLGVLSVGLSSAKPALNETEPEPVPSLVVLQPGKQITIQAAEGPEPSALPDTCQPDPASGNVLVSGLIPRGQYIAWWDVSDTDGGPSIYGAAQGSQAASRDGVLTVGVFLNEWPGYWELYVSPANAELFDETVAVVECEWWQPA